MFFYWQQNFRRIPSDIHQKLKDIMGDSIVVAAEKIIPISDIQKRMYAHVGIVCDDGSVTYKERIFPDPGIGKYSDRNRYGHEIVRKDLPKYWKTFYWKVPNCGENYEGPFEIGVDRFVYQKDYSAPGELEITIELMNHEISNGDQHYHFKFLVENVLDKTSDGFEDNLFHNLNLLLENVGVADVFESEINRTDYLNTTFVNWQILPAESTDVFEKILYGFNPSRDTKTEAVIKDRIEILFSMEPDEIVIGVCAFRKYLGAKYYNDLVVFESPLLGNATFVMYEDWDILSQMSRFELMNGNHKNFKRIIHSDGWDSRLKTIVKTLQSKHECNSFNIRAGFDNVNSINFSNVSEDAM